MFNQYLKVAACFKVSQYLQPQFNLDYLKILFCNLVNSLETNLIIIYKCFVNCDYKEASFFCYCEVLILYKETDKENN